MTAPWHGFTMPTVEDMCPCEEMPVIAWKRGQVILVRPMADADPIADAEAYSAGGWQEWAMYCPECGKVYLAGATT